MNTIKIDSKQAKMVAHRGLSGIERENTNPAFVAAGNRSYFGIDDVEKRVTFSVRDTSTKTRRQRPTALSARTLSL